MRILIIAIFALSISTNLYGQFSPVDKKIFNLSVTYRQFDYNLYNQQINAQTIKLTGNKLSVNFLDSKWEIIVNSKNTETKGAKDYNVVFRCIDGQVNSSNISVGITFDNWSRDNYVLMPGAAYNGNRYPSRCIRYSPKLLDPRDIGPDKGIILSDIPKLNEKNGPSSIQQRSGDMTTPSIGFYAPAQNEGFFLLTYQGNSWSDYGINISETSDRKQAVISVSSPLVRELYKYRIANMHAPSDDVPANFKKGDVVEINFRLYAFPSNNVQDLFNKFSSIRKDLQTDREASFTLSYSSAFEIQEDKFNKMNFVPDWGFR